MVANWCCHPFLMVADCSCHPLSWLQIVVAIPSHGCKLLLPPPSPNPTQIYEGKYYNLGTCVLQNISLKNLNQRWLPLLGSSGGVVNSLDFCLASLKSLCCFYFQCILSSHSQWKAMTVNFTLPTLKAFLEACSQNVSGNSNNLLFML